MDATTKGYINTSHPDTRTELTKIVQEIDAVLTGRARFRLTYSIRTFMEQEGLYALGRTKVNPDGKSKSRPMGYKVTNARGGQSIHNYGLAVDMALVIDGKTLSWDDVKDFDADGHSDWMECVAVFKRYGWAWGGDWSSFIDKPHFEKRFGLTLSQMQSRYASKDFLAGTQYIRISSPFYTRYKTTSGLNLRTGGGTEFPVIKVIPKDSVVIEVRRAGGWSQVEYGPYKGWVSFAYLTKV